MTLIRPLAGAVLAALVILPTLALAAPVALLPPGGGLGGDRETELVRPDPDRPREEPDPTASVQPIPPRGGSSDGDSYSSSESDTQPTLQTRHFGPRAELSCRVADTSNDLIVVNHSPEPLPPGTRIKWQLKGEGKRGFFALIGPLGGGETLVADDVIEGDAPVGADCAARII